MSLLHRWEKGSPSPGDRQQFLGITEEDSANVRQLRGVFADHARTFADLFYHHLLSHPTTREFLQDPEQLEQLKRLQAEYFSQLLEGVFNDDYIASRHRVGQTHQRVGLDPVWYLGAYNQYIQITFPIFVRAFGNNLEKVLPYLLSLVKVIFLDIGLALDTYFEAATDKLRSRNQELQKALGMYLQSHRREEQLRRMASHEVRGGLAAVITSLEDFIDVEGPNLDPENRREIENIIKRCWSLSNVLKEMLSPASHGGPTWVDTAQIFESLVARFGMYAEGRPIHLHLPELPPRVWADPLQLREVFANLIANAVRYHDKEPGWVEVSCLAEGEFYLFCVADNGPGIPTEVQIRLFEPFVRGEHAKRRTEGTGLGLYFVRTVIEQGGGRIWLESEQGQGSRFCFTVPRVPLGAPIAE